MTAADHARNPQVIDWCERGEFVQALLGKDDHFLLDRDWGNHAHGLVWGQMLRWADTHGRLAEVGDALVEAVGAASLSQDACCCVVDCAVPVTSSAMAQMKQPRSTARPLQPSRSSGSRLHRDRRGEPSS